MHIHNAAADTISTLHCENISLQLLNLELNNQSYTTEVLLSQYINYVIVLHEPECMNLRKLISSFI